METEDLEVGAWEGLHRAWGSTVSLLAIDEGLLGLRQSLQYAEKDGLARYVARDAPHVERLLPREAIAELRERVDVLRVGLALRPGSRLSFGGSRFGIWICDGRVDLRIGWSGRLDDAPHELAALHRWVTAAVPDE